MNDPPRDPREPILRREDWVEIATFSVLISASVLAVFGIALLVIEATTRQAVSIAFLALAGAQLVHVFNMRSRTENLVSNQITRNRYVWWALAICIGLLAAALFVPALADVLGLETPSGTGWLLVAAGTLTPLVGGQIARNLLRR
jgi:Ca2+-transporting ATPase